MTENNKPEWFEITDKDEKPELRKVSKSLPVSAVLVAALILGVGAVMGQTQNETPASAVTANAVQATDAQASPTSPTSTAVTAVKSAVSNPVTAAVVGTAAASKLANPSISKLPTGGGDDDEDDEHHGRGHHDDDEDDEDEDDD
jgi:phosphotransferase system  glucose/maltose/N-acetylglucosamine-specific IIC component